MARFKYVAKDMSGKVHKGTVEAASVAVIGLVLVIFVVRPKMTAKKAE